MEFKKIKITKKNVANKFKETTVIKHSLENYYGNVKDKIMEDFESLDFLDSYFYYYSLSLDIDIYLRKDFCSLKENEDISLFLENFFQGKSEEDVYVSNQVQLIYFTRCIFKEILKISNEMIEDIKDKNSSFLISKEDKEKISRLNTKIEKLNDFIEDSKIFDDQRTITIFLDTMHRNILPPIQKDIENFFEKYPSFSLRKLLSNSSSVDLEEEIDISLPSIVFETVYCLEYMKGDINIYKGEIKPEKIIKDNNIYYPSSYRFSGHGTINNKHFRLYITQKELAELCNKGALNSEDYEIKELTVFPERKGIILFTKDKFQELGIDILVQEQHRITEDFHKERKSIEEKYEKEKQYIEEEKEKKLASNNISFKEIIEKT